MIIKPLKIGELISSLPIIQGGMGIGVSLSNLASSVTNAGGIGLFQLLNAVIERMILKQTIYLQTLEH